MIDQELAKQYDFASQVKAFMATHTPVDAEIFQSMDMSMRVMSKRCDMIFNDDRLAVGEPRPKPFIMPLPNKGLWLRARRHFVTASDSSTLMHDKKSFKTIMELWREKVNEDGVLYDTDPEYKSLSEMEMMRMWWGSAMEDAIGKRLQLELERNQSDGVVLDPGDFTLFIDREHPWLAATIDRFIQFGDGRAQIAEFKFPTSPGALTRWVDHGPPEYVLVQIAHQMKVINIDSARVCALFISYDRDDDEPFVFKEWVYDRDDKYIKNIPSLALTLIDKARTGIKPHDWEFQIQ